MPTLQRPDRPPREIRSSYWPVKHWRELMPHDPRDPAFVVLYADSPRVNGRLNLAQLIVTLRDGTTFTDWWEPAMLWHFLHRPVFYQLRVRWHQGGHLILLPENKPRDWTEPIPSFFEPARNLRWTPLLQPCEDQRRQTVHCFDCHVVWWLDYAWCDPHYPGSHGVYYCSSCAACKPRNLAAAKLRHLTAAERRERDTE